MREEHLVREFIAEAEEHLARLEPQLLQLEREPENVALVQEIFIATHAIKGTAAYVGLAHISEFTHLVESVLDRLRQQELPVSPDIIDGLLQGLDSLQRLIRRVSAGQPVPDTTESERLLAQWLPSAPDPASPPCDAAPCQAESLASFDLSGEELQALEPEDVEIFADIAGQQLDAMRFSSECLARAGCDDAGPSATEARAAAAGLSKAFRTIQAAAAMLEMPSLHAVFARYAPEFAGFDKPGTLAEQTPACLGHTLDALEQVLGTLVHRPPPSQPTPPASSVTSSPTVPETPAEVGAFAGSSMLRVDVERIDALLNLTGELVTNRARLVQIEQILNALHDDVRTGTDAFLSPTPESRRATVRLLKRLSEQSGEATANLGRLAHQFQESAMRVRMIPISQVVSHFPRMVRDLSRQSGKQVVIDIQGADTELDKSVMDMIADPLIHLLRNAIDHGIEPPEEREAQGKAAQGRIRLAAAHHGNQVEITVQDDGRGVDPDLVKQQAVRRHLITPDDAAAMTDDDALALIFRSGFSTLDRASSLSGRGVGLHLVTRYLEQVHGALGVASVPGAGSAFTLTFPLTLAIIPALSVSIGPGLYAIPLTAVEEAIRIPASEISATAGRRSMRWRDQSLPLVALSDVLGEPQTPALTMASDILRAGRELPLPHIEEIFPDPFFEQGERAVSGVVISAGQRALGLEIDYFLGESDLVITPIKHALIAIDGISGTSIQPDGRIAFVLDAAALIRLAEHTPPPPD